VEIAERRLEKEPHKAAQHREVLHLLKSAAKHFKGSTACERKAGPFERAHLMNGQWCLRVNDQAKFLLIFKDVSSCPFTGEPLGMCSIFAASGCDAGSLLKESTSFCLSNQNELSLCGTSLPSPAGKFRLAKELSLLGTHEFVAPSLEGQGHISLKQWADAEVPKSLMDSACLYERADKELREMTAMLSARNRQ